MSTMLELPIRNSQPYTAQGCKVVQRRGDFGESVGLRKVAKTTSATMRNLAERAFAKLRNLHVPYPQPHSEPCAIMLSATSCNFIRTYLQPHSQPCWNSGNLIYNLEETVSSALKYWDHLISL